jgi:hypothetical protein
MAVDDHHTRLNRFINNKAYTLCLEARFMDELHMVVTSTGIEKGRPKAVMRDGPRGEAETNYITIVGPLAKGLQWNDKIALDLEMNKEEPEGEPEPEDEEEPEPEPKPKKKRTNRKKASKKKATKGKKKTKRKKRK